ncbi:MAG: nicotinate-nucleotide adenylyltransferase [Armatimonadota bacterium]|nr:nicotinate-nucleotide adenylyltransferase [Armatimonadota bacterium]
MADIGILGGTFDPIHYGHLIIAEESRLKFGLEKVIFVTAGDPPHKQDYTVSDAEHRYAMTVLATETNPFFECSRMEIERPGPSYTVDTILAFQEMVGQGTGIYLITGADAVLEIPTWHQPERLLSLCKLITATRPGCDLAELEKRVPAEYLERIIFLEVPGIYISSTDLRARVQQSRSIRYMVPDAVEQYVARRQLYR